ncbi:MAG TPA: hypothetical protein VFN10_09580 [Thermoanaerobaculia bacterium]|nr:hypothetical protein [Thermoanaerobaculia bacterium]
MADTTKERGFTSGLAIGAAVAGVGAVATGAYFTFRSAAAAAVEDPPPTELEKLAEEAREELRHAPDPAALTRRAYIDLLKTSHDRDTAAKLLGLTTEALEERLERGEIYGVKGRDGWLIPGFQFAAGKRLVPNLMRVLPRMRRDLHPLEVQHWLTTASSDFTIDGRKVSPLDWLIAGRDPELVERLASALGSWR